ncbi:hypothetical protein D3C75_512680 [compost metagenome]
MPDRSGPGTAGLIVHDGKGGDRISRAGGDGAAGLDIACAKYQIVGDGAGLQRIAGRGGIQAQWIFGFIQQLNTDAGCRTGTGGDGQHVGVGAVSGAAKVDGRAGDGIRAVFQFDIKTGGRGGGA